MERDICGVFSLDRVRLPILIKSIVHLFLVLISNDSLRKALFKGLPWNVEIFRTYKPCRRNTQKKADIRNLQVVTISKIKSEFIFANAQRNNLLKSKVILGFAFLKKNQKSLRDSEIPFQLLRTRRTTTTTTTTTTETQTNGIPPTTTMLPTSATTTTTTTSPVESTTT